MSEQQVGCERADGTLAIHSESDVCDVCSPSVPPGKEASMTLEVLESTAEPGVWRVEQIDVKSGDCYVTNFYGPDSEQRARRYFAMLSVPPGGEDDPWLGVSEELNRVVVSLHDRIAHCEAS